MPIAVFKNNTGLNWSGRNLKGIIAFNDGSWKDLKGSRVIIIDPDSIGASITLSNLEYARELEHLLSSGEAQEVSISELVEFYLKNEVYTTFES